MGGVDGLIGEVEGGSIIIEGGVAPVGVESPVEHSGGRGKLKELGSVLAHLVGHHPGRVHVALTVIGEHSSPDSVVELLEGAGGVVLVVILVAIYSHAVGVLGESEAR